MRHSAAANDLPAPPLRHPVRVAHLRREGEENRVRVSPDAEMRARIARFLDIEAVERMTLTGSLSPIPGGWEFRGQLTAAVVQSCVVTLEPVRSAIDTTVRRQFVRGAEQPEEPERVLAEADLEPPEPLGEEIDLGHVAVEALALSLEPWPRAEGAELGAGLGEGAEEEADERPFAGLAELRDKLSRGES